MTASFTAACIQNEGLADMDASVAAATELVRAARGEGAELLSQTDTSTFAGYLFETLELPAFRELGYKPGSCPAAESLAARLISLPIFPELTTEQQEQVVATIAGFYG